jgi:hypothetical protein
MKFDKYGRRYGEPLYTLSEIADKLGMEYESLKKEVSNRHKKIPAPKPVMKVGSSWSAGGLRNLYKLSEFKVWIKQYIGE